MQHKLELVYFKMRALAEAPRLLLHYLDLEYSYIMSWDYYGKEWSETKSKVPFRQLPMLVVDGEHEICQSIAILTFIEKIAGIEISDPILKANSILFLKILNKRETNITKENLELMKNNIIVSKKNELLNLFSNSHLTKVKNNTFINIK